MIEDTDIDATPVRIVKELCGKSDNHCVMFYKRRKYRRLQKKVVLISKVKQKLNLCRAVGF